MSTRTGNTRTFTVSFPEDLAKTVIRDAKSESRTISEYFRETVRDRQRQRALKAFRELREYAIQVGTNGYTEEDVPRLVSEVRAEMYAESQARKK